MADAHVASAHACTHASESQTAVNGERKVQHRGPLGQLPHLTVRSEYKYLLLIHVQGKVLTQFIRAGVMLQDLADAGHYAVCSTLTLNALVRPVCCQTTLRNVIHAACANLNLHPLVLRSVHRNMQRFIPVALGHAQPVAQPLGVGLVHIGHNAVYLPALSLLLIGRRIQYDANGKKVIDMVQSRILNLHLVPDARYGLGAPLNGELQSSLLKTLLNRSDERLDISLTFALGLVKLMSDAVIYIAVLILDHHILHLTLDGVQAKTVSHRNVKQPALLGHMQPILIIRITRQHPHQNIAVCNQAYDHANILGKRYQQFAEVLIGNGIMLGVKFLDAAHALNKLGRILAELLLELIRSDQPLLHHRIKQCREQRSLLEPRLLQQHYTSPYAPLQPRNPMSISPVSPFGNTLAEQPLKPAPILSLKQRPRRCHQLPIYAEFHMLQI